MTEQIDELIEEIKKYVASAVSASRYAHSVRTAETCARLCRKYGVDEKTGYLAGISHDMCKAMDGALLVSVASRDGSPISELEASHPGLLHGRAAAVKLREDFELCDPDVIEAVSNHTFGKPGMGPLAMILYVADKIEPGREHVTEKYMKKLESLSLTELVKFVLKENVDYLKKKGKAVAPESEALLKSLS